MPEPLVTIITPAYNFAQFLPETIESVLAQDYPNLEYIVLDDGSTDNTREVLAAYDDPRLKWESHENMGEPRTVNKGFQMGQGDYFFIVNADDPVLPGLVRTAVDFMEENPALLVAYPRWLWIDVNSEAIQEFPTYPFDYLKMLVTHHCYPGPGVIIRRKAIALETGRDVSFRWLSDYDFWLRVGLHGPFARIPGPALATQRKHEAARTYADMGMPMIQEHVRTVENFYQRDDLPPHVLAVENQALSHIYYLAGRLAMASDWPSARRYFLQSIRHCAFGLMRHPNGQGRSWLLMLRVILLPRAVNKFIKRLWRR